MQDLDALKSEIIGRIDGADTLDALDALRVSELGKKGRVSLMMRELGGMDPDARKAAGQALNLVKDSIAAAIEARQAELSRAALDARLATEAVDVSLPSRLETEARLQALRGGGRSCCGLDHSVQPPKSWVQIFVVVIFELSKLCTPRFILLDGIRWLPRCGRRRRGRGRCDCGFQALAGLAPDAVGVCDACELQQKRRELIVVRHVEERPLPLVRLASLTEPRSSSRRIGVKNGR